MPPRKQTVEPAGMRSGDPRLPLKIGRMRAAMSLAGQMAERSPQLEPDPEFEEWENSVQGLLTEVFGVGSYLLRFRQLTIRPISYFMGGHRDWYAEPKQAWTTGLSQAQKILSEAIEEAELLSGNTSSTLPATSASRTHGNRVFIVHGHDDAARESVARFLERLGVEAIVLHEKPTAGRTIIEKLEHYADADFAVILLTPDDLGGSREEAPGQLHERARQNVILELGYFVGRLGRKNVCALYKGAVELPSDYLGVVYVPLDVGGGWRLQLAKELRSAQFNVDMNLAL